MEGAAIIVDCRAHMLGRLASVLAKELMSGQHVVRPRATLPCRCRGLRRWSAPALASACVRYRPGAP